MCEVTGTISNGRRGTCGGFAFAWLAGLSGCSCRWLRRLCRGLGRLGQIQITAARIAELNVQALEKSVDGANGQTHVATGAGLVPHEGNPFLAANDKPVVVTKNGLW